jgi:hypothetical protein
MHDSKRVYTATTMGFLCGITCFIIGKYMLNLPLGISNLGFILLNRTLMGFVIGISALNMHWVRHGALIGTVVGLIFAYGDLMMGFPWYIILSVLLVNPVFGIVIEFVTTIVFNAPVKSKNTI